MKPRKAKRRQRSASRTLPVEALESRQLLAAVIGEFPNDLQLYPRDTATDTATVSVSGSITGNTNEVTLNVYRNNVLWSSTDHAASSSQSFAFSTQVPAELAKYDFELIGMDSGNVQTELAFANDVVAGDVYVINGQSNAAAGIYSAIGPGNDDANEFVRTYGTVQGDQWVENDTWYVVKPESRPASNFTANIGRWGLRFASELSKAEQIPVAVLNGALGGQSIDHFQRNDANPADTSTNYGRLLTRLSTAGVKDDIRGMMWYQGESDRLDIQGHIDGFTELYTDWEEDYPSVERTYIFQIRHTCVPNDLVTGQGSEISNFQREFSNAREDVTPVSTTGLDGHDSCHFAYTNGYQDIGDNMSRMVRRDFYDPSLQNADAPDIKTANLVNANTIDLTFTANNTLIADPGFEGLFELRSVADGSLYQITNGTVLSGSTVRLTTADSIPNGTELTLNYLSLYGDQDWLTNQAGIGILSFRDFPVNTNSGSVPTVGETGQVSVDGNWQTVTLSHSYVDPVVVAGPPSFAGLDPSTMRVRNVMSNSFQIRLDEWDYLDGNHSIENAHYMVVEAGEHTLADGTVLVAANQFGQGNTWKSYDLGSSFNGADDPIVFSQAVTTNDDDAVSTRMRFTSDSTFELRLQEQESSGGAHVAETVSYIAIESGSGTTSGSTFQATTVSAGSTNKNFTFNSSTNFSAAPAFFASMQSYVGSDPAAIRYTQLSSTGATFFVEEESSRDSERSHSAETVGLFAIQQGDIIAQPQITIYGDENFGGPSWQFTEGTYNVTDLLNTPVGNDKISSIQIPAGMSVTVYQHGNLSGNSATYTTSMPSLGNLNNQISSMVVSQAPLGEAGQVTTDHNWTTVNLSGSYNDPVVIVGPPSRVGGSQISLKVSNVTSNSFQIRVNEWDYLDGTHSVESISYMVLEAGQYTLTDGTVLVAGNQSGQDHDWSTYSLGTAFSGQSAPIVLTNTVTDIGSAAVTTRTIVNSNSSFQVRLQEEEAADGTHSPETISYVAIEQGTGTTGTSAFNAGTVSATSADKNFSFSSAAGFGTTPAFFAGMQTFNGADSATLRYKSVNAAGATIFVEEEQSLDSEVTHTSEDIGFFAIKFGPISGTRVGSPLQAAGQPAAGVDAELISGDDIESLTAAAENYWADQGADTSLFDSVNYVVTNLDGNLLGLQSGNTIFIDDDAAGFGWYIDGNAATNELFGGMDLFTTLSHELGHVLGYEDIYDDSESVDLMYGYLDAGERRIEPAVVNSAVDSMFADLDEKEHWFDLF